MIILAFLFEQLRSAAGFDNLPILQHNNLIGVFDRGQTMRDDDHGTALTQMETAFPPDDLQDYILQSKYVFLGKLKELIP